MCFPDGPPRLRKQVTSSRLDLVGQMKESGSGDDSPYKPGLDMDGNPHDVAIRIKVLFDKMGNAKAEVRHGNFKGGKKIIE